MQISPLFFLRSPFALLQAEPIRSREVWSQGISFAEGTVLVARVRTEVASFLRLRETNPKYELSPKEKQRGLSKDIHTSQPTGQ